MKVFENEVYEKQRLNIERLAKGQAIKKERG